MSGSSIKDSLDAAAPVHTPGTCSVLACWFPDFVRRNAAERPSRFEVLFIAGNFPGKESVKEKFVSVKGTPVKEFGMFRRIRFFSLAAALALLNLMVSLPANRLEAQGSFEGESTLYDLSTLVKSDEIKKSIARFKMAVSGLKNAAGEAKVIVQDATRAFEQARSRKTEADLIVANARAVKVQFHALEEFRTAARDQEQAIDGVLVKLQLGKEALGGEIKELNQEKTAANEKASKAGDALTRLAVAANLVGKKGKLTSDLVALIKHLNWSREQELQVGKDAAVVQQEAEGRLRKFDDIVASLRKTKTNLGYSAGAAVTLQANLSRVARWQAKALTWRQLVDNSAALSQSMPTDITEFIPTVRYPGLPGRPAPLVKGKEDSLATDEQEASEILKNFLPKPAKKKTVVKEAPAAKKASGGKPVAGKKTANEEATGRQAEATETSARVSLDDILRDIDKGEGNEN